MFGELRKKTEKQEPISVVYLGGSITEGAGASAVEKRWASLVEGWMEAQFPDCRFSCHNAGIGGTDSEFGVFRLERDVLMYEPDLVFVEFAVNDYGKDGAICLNAMEGIVRTILEKRPDTALVVMITAMYKMEEECYGRGLRPESVAIHEQVAKHYGIPVVLAGETLLARIREEGCDPTCYLPDLVHPNDRGYEVYYREAVKCLASALEKAGRTHPMPKPLGDLRYTDVRMVDAVRCETEFRREAISLCGRYQGYISSNRPGETGSFAFEGSGVGVYWMIAADSGNLLWNVDGGEWKETSSWDAYALRFDRCHSAMFVRGLPRGKHRLDFRVAPDRETQSKGHFIRIAAFLVM